MFRRRLLLALMLVVGVIATGSAAGLDAPVLRDVRVSGAPSSARYKELGPGGGSLTVQLANQSEVTLTIPPRALLGKILIGLEPVTAIGNLPRNRVPLAAVRIKPDGFMLVRPATLGFTARKTVSIEKQWAATARADGREFHAIPLRLTTQPVLRVDDFGLYAFLEAVDTPGRDWRGQATNASSAPPVPSRSTDLVGATLTETLQRFRSQGVRESAPEVQTTLASADLDYLNKGVKPLIERAGESDAAFQAAMTAYMTWLRARLLLGDDEEEVTRIGLELGKELDGARQQFIQRAIADCRKGTGGRGAATRRLMAVVRQLLLTGVYTEDTLPREVQVALENCESEAKYELEVLGSVHQRVRPKSKYLVTAIDGTFHMKKRFSGRFSDGALSFSADVPVTWRTGSATTIKDCKAAFATSRTKLYIRMNIVYDGRGDAANVRLLLVPHATPSEIAWSCPDIEGRVKRGFWLGSEALWDNSSQRDFELAGENADLATSGTGLGDKGGLRFSSSARIKLRRLDTPAP